MKEDFQIGSEQFHIYLHNFNKPSYWLSDFINPKHLTQNRANHTRRIYIDAVLTNNERSKTNLLKDENQRIVRDGKWEILVLKESDYKFARWHLVTFPSTNVQVISKKVGEDIIFQIEGTSEVLIGKLIRQLIVIPQIINHRYAYLHGTALSHNGKGIFLLGSTKSGKTTYGYALWRHGWDIVAEDFILLRPDKTIPQFFTTVDWECRITTDDIELIDRMYAKPTHYPENNNAWLNFPGIESIINYSEQYGSKQSV
jgi:hypothetical protein